MLSKDSDSNQFNLLSVQNLSGSDLIDSETSLLNSVIHEAKNDAGQDDQFIRQKLKVSDVEEDSETTTVGTKKPKKQKKKVKKRRKTTSNY